MSLVRILYAALLVGLVALTACEGGGAPDAVVQPVAPPPPVVEEPCDDQCQLRIQADIAEHRRKQDSQPFTWGK